MLTEIKKKQPQSNKIFSDLTKQHKTTISLTTMTDFLPSRMHTKADSVGEMWKMYNSLWQAVLWPDKKIFFLVSCWLAHDKSPWRSIFVNARVWKSDYIFLDWLILNNLKWFCREASEFCQKVFLWREVSVPSLTMIKILNDSAARNIINDY